MHMPSEVSVWDNVMINDLPHMHKCYFRPVVEDKRDWNKQLMKYFQQLIGKYDTLQSHIYEAQVMK